MTANWTCVEVRQRVRGIIFLLGALDDGLTKLERAQIEQGREAYLTGGAKLRYKRLTGQI